MRAPERHVKAHAKGQSAEDRLQRPRTQSRRDDDAQLVVVSHEATDAQLRATVDGKDVGGKLTKADFAVKTDSSVCRMTKTTAPWVRQKAAGYTADGNTQMVLKQMIVCEECYSRQSGACA